MKESYRFCYSPAHMEDIGSALMWSRGMNDTAATKAAAQTMEKVNSISKLTDNLEIFPGESNSSAILKTEYPGDCLMRVLERSDDNYMLDPREKEMMDGFKERDPDGSISKSVSNLSEQFLLSPEYGQPLLDRLKSKISYGEEGSGAQPNDYSWKNISKSHGVMLHVFEEVFNYLEEIRYRPDAAKKYRSHLHDVSHAIYASNAEYFITSDAKFAHKVRAAYAFLEVETQVMGYSEFIERPDLFPLSACS
ncbi:hypothetical protein ABE494_09985 [Stenotrophomonas lactitubi]|uniref:hypothetical protein n=1 Tax=Stenotrophomonas lactitubi TaxID=2045214 RepID=UPI00320B7003